MHLVLLHGYLLRGTGSNIYVANIAKAWRSQGHAVTVMCQDRRAHELPFVDDYIGPADQIPRTAPGPGTIRVVVPPIDDLLPVYVMGPYEGFKVKTIPLMTSSEIHAHIERTARALFRVAEQGVDRVLANHVMLSPVIARRALQITDVPYDVKIHGSALEYSLVPHPHLMGYAIEGLRDAKTVFAGTRYVRDRTIEVFATARDLRLEEKLCIVPPGMDPELFTLADDFTVQHGRVVNRIEQSLRNHPGGRRAHRLPSPKGRTPAELHRALVDLGETYDQRTVDADLLDRWPALAAEHPIVLYVGNFLGTKGVGELLMAVPHVLAEVPEARFVFVGFGPYREHMEGMLRGMGTSDRALFSACAIAGDFVEVDPGPWYRPLTPDQSERITITGMLEHHTLSALLPLAAVSVVPSKWPEAFGMVAVEALSAGVLPLCNYHAGLRDIVDEVARAAPPGPELADLMSIEREGFAEQLPQKIIDALRYLFPSGFHHTEHRARVGTALRHVAVEQFSWDGIARRLVGHETVEDGRRRHKTD